MWEISYTNSETSFPSTFLIFNVMFSWKCKVNPPSVSDEDALENFYEVSKRYCSIEEIEDYKKDICEPDGSEAGGCCMSREYQVFSMSQRGALDFVLFIPLLFFGLLDVIVIPLILIYVYRRGRTLFSS